MYCIEIHNYKNLNIVFIIPFIPLDLIKRKIVELKIIGG
jgi:hypothetical protein